MKGFWKKWLKDDTAIAAIEAGMLFPVMVSIMLGVVDLGAGLTVNQKLVNSTHMFADLLAREDDVNDAEFNNAAVAAEMVIQPYSTVSFGYDVVGVQFVSEDEDPTEVWRDTFNMSENASAVTDSEDMGLEGEGLIVVTVSYTFQPFFANFLTGPIDMDEVSFARGRSGLFVSRSE